MAVVRHSAGVRQRVLILGAGGHGRVVLDILLQAGDHHVVGFLDNNAEIHGRRIDGLPVLGSTQDVAEIAAKMDLGGVIVAIGDNGVRRGLARQIEAAGLELINAVHPSSALAQNVTLGRNVVVAAGVVVCARTVPPIASTRATVTKRTSAIPMTT